MPNFSSYLESVRRYYEQWWSLHTLTNAEGRSGYNPEQRLIRRVGRENESCNSSSTRGWLLG